MILLIQRVLSASVIIHQKPIAQINQGILALVGFESQDNRHSLEQGFHKLIHYRMFNDPQGKMNLNVQQVGGELLIVPQFTLVADTQKGLRPSFSRGASPQQGAALFDQLQSMAGLHSQPCQWGQFGADMQVQLINDGPVTFLLNIPCQ